MYDNIYENIQIYKDSNNYFYQKHIDYIEEKQETGSISENLELISIINSIFIY